MENNSIDNKPKINKGFCVPSQIVGMRCLSDGGLSVNLHTKELPPVEKALIMEYINKAGWFLFSENSIKDEDVPKQDAELNQKTLSQRLRAVLFIWWQQLGEKEKFQDFYEDKMEKFIEHIKSKLL
jgi:hypothetical protein